MVQPQPRKPAPTVRPTPISERMKPPTRSGVGARNCPVCQMALIRNSTSATLLIAFARGMPPLIYGKWQEYCMLRGGGRHDIVERHGAPVKDMGAWAHGRTAT